MPVTDLSWSLGRAGRPEQILRGPGAAGAMGGGVELEIVGEPAEVNARSGRGAEQIDIWRGGEHIWQLSAEGGGCWGVGRGDGDNGLIWHRV